ncbi:MAG: sulfatase-like hydrolase/transferase, partial [Thermomicrobiales bacterium]
PAGVPVTPRVTDALVELIDISATVEAITGIEPTHTHFGRSLLPLLAGDSDAGRDAVFCEGGRLVGEDQAKELDSPGSHDVRDLYWPRVGLQATNDVSHTKAIMCRTANHKYVRRLYERDELYDLTRDPAELDNRIDDPAYIAVLDQLRDRMLTHLLETSDVVPFEPDARQ